jgi:hypothetical protein
MGGNVAEPVDIWVEGALSWKDPEAHPMANENESKPKNPLDTLKQIFDNLVTLNIVTAVGDVDITTGKDGGQKLAIKPGTKVLWTAIDMLEGDIKTSIHPDFAGDAGKELRAFHASREQQGQAIIKNNIEALEKLLVLIEDLATKNKSG